MAMTPNNVDHEGAGSCEIQALRFRCSMTQFLDSWMFIITSVLCFWLGYFSSFSSFWHHDIMARQRGPYQVDRHPQPFVTTWQNSTRGNDAVRREQIQAMNEFQELVQQQQEHPADCSRVLTLTIRYNGTVLSWIDSLEVTARALKVALSTERRLVLLISGDKDGSFCHFPGHAIYCQFIEKDDLGRCRAYRNSLNYVKAWRSPLRQGVQSEESDFFNVRYYGPDAVVVLPDTNTSHWPKSWMLEKGLSWERSWGAWWLHSQLLYYLHVRSGPGESKSLVGTNKQEQRALTVTLIWDQAAQDAVRHKFARDSEKTHSWDRIRVICSHIQSQYIKKLSPSEILGELTFVVIVLIDEAADNVATFPSKSFEQEGWKLLTNQQEKDKQLEDITWNALISSQFMIGSFASAWFRVSTALNMPKMLFKRNIGKQYYWPLDIEWLEVLQGV